MGAGWGLGTNQQEAVSRGREDRHAVRGRRRFGAGGAFVVLLLTMIAFGPPAVGAQEAQIQATAAPAASPRPTGNAAAAPSFQSLGYGDATARSTDSVLSFFFPVPAGRTPDKGSEIDLRFSHSPLLLATRSTLTVVVNGQSLDSIFLTRKNVDEGRLRVTLPVAASGDDRIGGYAIDIAFHLRLTEAECEEPQNPALWATVHGDSAFNLRVKPSPGGADLADLAGLFAPTGSSAPPVTLVLSTAPTPEELEAAGVVTFQLGRWAAEVGQEPAIKIATGKPPADGPVILVGTGATWRPAERWGDLRWGGKTYAVAGTSVPNGAGVLALKIDPSPRLLVSGDTPAAVLEAAHALAQPARRDLLGGDHAILAAMDVPAAGSEAAWQEGAASFAQLGVERRAFTGPGEHILDLAFERPPEWIIRDGASLQLLIESSTGIKIDTSWVAASVNGRDVGTFSLQPEEGSGRYSFALPASLLNTSLANQPLRALVLQARIYIDVQRTGCEPIDPAAAWATVLPTSAWILPHDRYDVLDLGRFPAPLLEANDPTAPMVVLPNEPTSDDLQVGLQLSAALGRWTGYEQTSLPRAVTAGRLTSDDRASRGLILIGDGTRNPVSQDASSANANAVALIAPVVARVPGEGGGWLRLTPCPWSSDRAILTIGGDDATGLKTASDALTDPALLQQLRGVVAAVVDGLPPQSRAAASPVPAAPADLAPYVVVAERPLVERLPAWQIAGAVLLGALIATIILVVTVRWTRRRRA